MVVAVATPLYARSSAEHLLDQRTRAAARDRDRASASRPRPVAASAWRSTCQDGERKPTRQTVPLSQDASGSRCSSQVTDLVTTDAGELLLAPPTTYLLTPGEYRAGAATYQINTYWRDGMCENAHVEGRCPSAPGRGADRPDDAAARSAPKVGDDGHRRLHRLRRPDGSEPVVDFPQTYTIVGTYTIDDNARPYWFNPGHGPAATGRCGRRPSAPATPPQAPALLVDQSSITFNAATVAGADRPIDLDALDIATMDAAQRQLVDLADRDRRPGSADPPAATT